MTGIFTRNGKQILLDGAHFGDGCSEDAAAQIVAALTAARCTCADPVQASDSDCPEHGWNS